MTDVYNWWVFLLKLAAQSVPDCWSFCYLTFFSGEALGNRSFRDGERRSRKQACTSPLFRRGWRYCPILLVICTKGINLWRDHEQKAALKAAEASSPPQTEMLNAVVPKS
ncbi:hypothetical protein IEQ34_020863 [Dendrobium chrysotoxum]|uniref:Uncharacterized protein n=1 Tax=Dendrobium chrysotoxum TaxID=161865 RepID=A0AAV7G227_DENCH|nr:hypothetical protein IEQ34_020863 [Dendrobium chrysotoxum]